MPYSFFDASRLISSSPKESMLQSYQTLIDQHFTHATDIFTIQEEVVFASRVFSDVTIRLNRVVGENGLKLSDDFRKVIFQDMTHARGLGYKFLIDGSTWLTINYDLYGKPTASTIIRKCRNVLKFVDRDNGALLEEPCVIENYSTQNPKPFFTKSIVIPEGYIIADVQGNDITRKIKVNQRFIFNGLAYKVWNVLNELQNPTTNGNSPLLYIVLGIDTVNPELDDLSNNIASVNDYQYTLNILQNDFQQLISTTKQLTANVYLNGEYVTRNVIWTSSNVAIGTITSAGVISLLALGSVTFTCALVDNPLVHDHVVVTVVNVITPTIQTIVNPSDLKILQGETMVYTIYKYLNGTPSTDTFTFALSGISTTKYTFTAISGNSYSIKNLERVIGSTLKVSATNVVTLEITETDYTLGGVF
jgi:hypothetical protein